ncbi:cobyrinate a,c-diamide synthase [Blautia faecicola]|uniref:cobyrinate a,c-diamide synthase n=1 Tax=Blautia faecicola TaxID=2509240 RepID=UPI003FD89C8B
MNKQRKVPRILLGAAASGSGKTLITCGLLQALKNRKLQVTSFKCGPDYIDPMFHSRVIGTKSRNLDSFFADEDTVRYLLEKNARDCEISVIEGVMGYYDGLAGISPKASAYDVAKITKTPAVLIVNAKGMSLSAAAFIKGFVEYQEDSQIRGVILNQVSSMMYPRLKQIIEEELSIKVYGYVPVVKDCVLESRHLGLVMPEEIVDLQQKLMELAEILEKSVDIDGLLELAEHAEELPVQESPVAYHTGRKIRIALAKDEAFCFFYQDNLELLEEMGAELVPFSPIHDKKLPEHIDGMLFHGGYPELYAKKLSENKEMLAAVCAAVQTGIPYMAECGGFMYLHQEMEDMEGHSWPMAGVIHGKSWRTPRLTRFGYITLEDGTCFGEHVGAIRAHEFHYFDSDRCGEAYTAKKPLSSRSWKCIHSDGQGMSGFPHMYYYSNLRVPEQFLRACEERKAEV